MASCPKQEAIPYKLATSKHVCLLIKAIFVTKNIRLSLKFIKSQVKNTKINGISVFGRVKTRLSAGSTTKNYNPLGKLYGNACNQSHKHSGSLIRLYSQEIMEWK